MKKSYTVSREKWDSMKKVRFHNVARDFHMDLPLEKTTASGNLVVWEDFSMDANSVRFHRRIAKKRGSGRYFLTEPGSPLNSYSTR